MVEPFPFVAPTMFALGRAVHQTVVAAAFLGDGSIVTNAVYPLRLVQLDRDGVGRGLTVATRSAGAPAHNPVKGTILNVTVPSTLPVLMGVSLILPEPDALTEEASIGPSIEVVQSNV